MRDLLDRFNELAANYSDETADEFARLQEQIDAADAWNLDTQLDSAMDALRLPARRRRRRRSSPAASAAASRSAGCCCSAPDLLLLDEPTNHLDAESVAWLEQHLEDYKGTIVAVTHDRYFLDNVAGWILELDRGHGIPFKGNYSSWLEQKQERLAQEEKHGVGAPAHDRARARVGAREPEGPAHEVQGAPEPLRARCSPRSATSSSTRSRSTSRPGRASATW